MLEKELQKAVVETAHRFGWMVAHFGKAIGGHGAERWITPAAYDAKGFPDLVLVRERLIFRELKTGSALSASQIQWIDWLQTAGQDASVWSESDWKSGLIERELRDVR